MLVIGGGSGSFFEVAHACHDRVVEQRLRLLKSCFGKLKENVNTLNVLLVCAGAEERVSCRIGKNAGEYAGVFGCKAVVTIASRNSSLSNDVFMILLERLCEYNDTEGAYDLYACAASDSDFVVCLDSFPRRVMLEKMGEYVFSRLNGFTKRLVSEYAREHELSGETPAVSVPTI